MDVAEAVPEDVAEPDQDRQLDAAQQQVIDQCFRSIERAGSFVGWTSTCPVGRDREVALPPAVDLVELGGIGDGEDFSGLPVAMTAGRGSAHANMIKENCTTAKGKRNDAQRPSRDSAVRDRSVFAFEESDSARRRPRVPRTHRIDRHDHWDELPVHRGTNSPHTDGPSARTTAMIAARRLCP